MLYGVFVVSVGLDEFDLEVPQSIESVLNVLHSSMQAPSVPYRFVELSLLYFNASIAYLLNRDRMQVIDEIDQISDSIVETRATGRRRSSRGIVVFVVIDLGVGANDGDRHRH